MKYKIYLFFTLFLSLKAADHSQEVSEWNTKYLENKIGQEAVSLLVQRMYYLFVGFNKGFKSNTDTNIKPIDNALNQINAAIKKIDKGQIATAFKALNKRLDSFKAVKNNPKSTLLNFFSLLKVVYSTLYESLANKKITIGPDKNKLLPSPANLDLPNAQEIEIWINNRAKVIAEKARRKK